MGIRRLLLRGYCLHAATDEAVHGEMGCETLRRNAKLDEEGDYEQNGSSKPSNGHRIAN